MSRSEPLSTLDVAALRGRAEARLTAAAAITSCMLALILGTVMLALGSGFAGDGSGSGVDIRSLGAAVLSMVPAGFFGGAAMHRGATRRNEGSALGWATLGGVGFLSTSLICLLLATANGHLLEAMGLVIIVSAIGAIVSAPTGFAFGLLFLIALSPTRAHLETPAQDAPSQASRASAGMLIVAALVAAVCAASLEVPYVDFVLDLGLHVAAWTRFVVFVGPFLIALLPFAMVAAREERALEAHREAILRGTHPEYYPGDIAPDALAIPLTSADRESPNKRALIHRASSAYRGGEASQVSVYIGT